ncbi:MAG: putative porin, partial [Bacteroidales bacterium]|nr:putative porin [Bacteroidales bacterium]
MFITDSVKRVLTMAAGLMLAAGALFAQNPDSLSKAKSPAADSLKSAVTDSVKISAADSVMHEATDSVKTAVPDSAREIVILNPEDIALGLDTLLKPVADTTHYPSMEPQSAYLDSILSDQYDSLYQFIVVTVPSKSELRKTARETAKAFRDSVRLATPRMLNTFALPDSMYYKRMLYWQRTTTFNDINLKEFDTTYNYHFTEYPFMRDDVNATYLGVIGSPALNHNYFTRQHDERFPFYDNYLQYSYTVENVPFYNVKTPYTILSYWGTPFAGTDKETSDVYLLTTQNLTPAFNFTIFYKQFGARGEMSDEKTDCRTFGVTVNNLGKKYLMHAGYISQRIIKSENGGMTDSFWGRDTSVAAATIPTSLSDAGNELHRKSYFISQSYAIPFNFFRKNRDSLSAGEGTAAYIGHSGEFTEMSKVYTDEISESSTDERAFYNNQFYINPTVSNDSISYRKLDNKVFLKLQPFAPDAIISRINGGIGYEWLNYYGFDLQYFLSGNKSISKNNLYAYAEADGMFRKYFRWDANARYDYAGYNANDFKIDGSVKLAFYPFKGGISLNGKVSESLHKPDWFSDHLLTNHYKWENDFGKISESRIEANLDIPIAGFKAGFGYALVNNMIYYDSLSIVRQAETPISIMSIFVQENFRI